jgi:hypothetical protein
MRKLRNQMEKLTSYLGERIPYLDNWESQMGN